MGSFFRVPKAFEKADLFKTATLEAKYLYSLMLDRVHISARNGWLDAGRVFIYYTLKEVIRTVKVGKNKALQILHELEDLGLILRKKQGQGKPAKIFVRNIIETDAETIPIQNTKDTQNAQNIENAESAETAGNEESIDKASVSGQDTEDMRDTQSAGTEDTNARNEKWDTPAPVSDYTPEPENAASAVDTLDAQASDAESQVSPASISSDNHQDAPVYVQGSVCPDRPCGGFLPQSSHWRTPDFLLREVWTSLQSNLWTSPEWECRGLWRGPEI